MIFRSLARPELKSVSLVSKEFDNAAKVFLFRQILPRRNMDSFCKVRLIRSKPHLAKFVKALAYSGKTLWHGDGEADYGRWYQERIGQGQMASQPCDEIERRMESVTTDELHHTIRDSVGTITARRMKLSRIVDISFGPNDSPLRCFCSHNP